jgi:single-strand DNA-binding protein
MAFDNTLTVVGNMTRDPELRYTANGVAVTDFGLAWNRKDKDDNEVVSFFDVTCWRDLAEHVAESLGKGIRVVVHGRMEQDTWENDQGEKRSKVKVIAEEVAPSLRWATVTVQKTTAPKKREGASDRTGFPTDEEPF